MMWRAAALALALLCGTAQAQQTDGVFTLGGVFGPAGGDLSGTYPNPTVAKVNGVSPTTCASHQWLTSVGVCAQPAVGDISGFGTGVATALGVNVGTAGAFVVNGGALGTPSGGTLTNATGLPIAGITGLGTNIASLLAANASAGSWTCSVLSNAAASCATDTTNASNISSGALAVARGGTGVNNGVAGGFLNKLRNGTFDIWQRGTSSLATSTSSPGSYTADGWQVQQAGAAGTCVQDTGNNGTKFSIKCVGITSNTDTVFRQPIESNIAYPLASQTITVQFQFKQDTGSSVTPKLSTCYASSSDNFGTCTGDLASTALTACTSGSWCTEAYTLSASANAINGYRVEIDCNTALTSAQHCWITAADVRVSSGVTIGVNASPPPPELPTIAQTLVLCRRYLNVIAATINNFTIGTGISIDGTHMDALVSFGTMRSAPNVTYPSASEMRFVINGTATTGSAVSTNAVTLDFLDARVTVASATGGQAGIAQLLTSGDQIILTSEF